MSVSNDILASYRRPRQVVRRILAAPEHEGRALAYAMAGCLVLFVAQWPRLSREAFIDPSVPLEARLGGALIGIVVILPLLLYGIAALARGGARLLGGRGDFYRARVALFWALLAVSPLVLLNGLVAGFIGPGPEQTLTGALLLGAFFYIWGAGALEAERPSAATSERL